MSDSHVRGLIRALNDPDTDTAEEAKAELQTYGTAIQEPLLEAIPTFDDFGILLAIDLLQELGDERAGVVLIPLLSSDNPVVREWAARALGDLGVRESVDALNEAHEHVKAQGTRLDWTEPVAIRTALTQLGARHEVVPPLVAALKRDVSSVGSAWRIQDVAQVIDALAEANQAVVSATVWAESRDRYRWVQTQSWEPDWTLRWAKLVEQTRRDSKEAVTRAHVSSHAVVTLTWMDERDL